MLTIPLADVDLLDIGPNPIWGIVSRLRRVDAVIVIKAGPKRLCISRRLREVATQALIGQVLLSLIPTKKQSDRVLARPEVLLRDDTIERI